MRRSKTFKIILSGILLLTAGLLTLSYFTIRLNYGILEGRVVDELSRDVVRRLTISLGERTDILFQSKDFRFSGIQPGRYTLQAWAPHYEPFTREIEVQRGINAFDFAMRGAEIPDLAGIICFATPLDRGIEIEIRFHNTENRGITDFPALPLELTGSLFIREGDQENYTRGRLIYEGTIELFWDPEAHLARNKGIIPWDEIHVDPELEQRYGVLDLVLTTPQGVFEDTITNVEFTRREE
ncbi:MAG TPA: carboxypeptidase-like regulatory domain-containing protein [Atribacteraceae bacterium]|nr:carboxypeptidase-like regulatory domain-containing protein [Atribacteraceae bacterium]